MPKQKEVQITIPGIPAELLRDIDELAKGDGRKRAAFVRMLLAEIVATKRQKLAA